MREKMEKDQNPNTSVYDVNNESKCPVGAAKRRQIQP